MRKEYSFCKWQIMWMHWNILPFYRLGMSSYLTSSFKKILVFVFGQSCFIQNYTNFPRFSSQKPQILPMFSAMKVTILGARDYNWLPLSLSLSLSLSLYVCMLWTYVSYYIQICPSILGVRRNQLWVQGHCLGKIINMVMCEGRKGDKKRLNPEIIITVK